MPDQDIPCLILTLQRTGGTNFTQCLNDMSSRPTAEHEPFLPDRMNGAVTRAWVADGDDERLRAEMTRIAAQGSNMKHCVENVPAPVTDALVDATAAAGHGHLFLYRRAPLGRILSAEYARRTGAWGPDGVAQLTSDDAAFEAPLDVGDLLRRERENVAALERCWRRAVEGGGRPMTLSFEELYGADAGTARDAIARVLDYLGRRSGDASDAAEIADGIRGRGDQGTRDRYARFDGVDALRAGLDAMEGPRFDGA